MCIRDRIIAAPHLADGACVHAPVWAGYKRDFESLCIHKVPQTGTAEGADGLDHLRGQPVSYTHLDVYKRQAQLAAALLQPLAQLCAQLPLAACDNDFLTNVPFLMLSSAACRRPRSSGLLMRMQRLQ